MSVGRGSARLPRRRAPAVAPAALAAVLAAVLALPAVAQPIATGRADVLLRRDCRSEIARQEVTLFGNGTVRLRSGPVGEERMVLGELSRDAVASLVAAIRAEDLREAGAGAAGPDGDWVQLCVLELPILVAPSESSAEAAEVADAAGTARREEPLGPGRPAGDRPGIRFRYGHLDSLSLPLARVVGLVDGLASRTAAAAAAGGLPTGYRPRSGDVLRRADGVLFRVVRSTAGLEGMPAGWELQGVVQPLAVYIFAADLAAEFVELVSRDEAYGP